MGSAIGIGIGIPFLRGGAAYKMLLTSTGDGSGISTITLTTSADMTVTLDGAARFYSDAAGTLDESTSFTFTTGTHIKYLKVPSGTSNMAFSNIALLTKWYEWASFANAASLSGDVSKLLSLDYMNFRGKNTLFGSVAALTSLTYMRAEGSNTISGDISALTSLTSIRFFGSNTLSGSVAALTSLTSLYVTGSNTLSGSIAALTSLTYLQVRGTNTISGDMNPVVNGITYFYISGNNHMDTYTAGATWSIAGTCLINPYTGYGYSSTEIDNILIDLNNSGVINSTITLQGSSAARTSASDAAVNNLVANGCTVNTN